MGMSDDYEDAIAAGATMIRVGSAIFGAVAAGVYDTVEAAIRSMASPIKRVYEPISHHAEVYEALYREYKTLHDYFSAGENDVMKRLKKLKNSVQ